MRKLGLYILLLTSIATQFACIKKPDTKTFNTYCKTSITAKPEGGDCSGDWRFDDEFTKWENNLFSTSNSTSADTAAKTIICYPNACNGQTTLDISLPSSGYTLDYRLVNQKLDVIVSASKIIDPVTILTLDFSDKVSSGEFVRLYYIITSTTGKVFRGHGDIAIIK
jgi:hypothetical protein